MMGVLKRGHSDLLVGIIVIYVIRLVIVFTMGLMPQDAYYAFYADHLAWSYFDHPPMVAYMVKLYGSILGKNEIALKVGNFITTFLTVYLIGVLGLRLLPKSKLLYAMILLMSTFMISILSVVTTPDVPLLIFWALSLIWIHKSLFESGIWRWIIAGFFIGMAINSKYTGIFLIPGVLIFIILSKSHREFLFSKNLLLLMSAVGITIFPVIWWNHLHDWASFSFQGQDRLGQILNFRVRPLFLLGMFGHQCFILLPILFVGLFFVIRRKLVDLIHGLFVPSETLFLLSFSLPIILFFVCLSPFYWIKLNWIMPGYVTAILLSAVYFSKRLIKYQVWLSVFIHLLFFTQILFYPVNVRSDDTWWGWEELVSSVEKLTTDYPQHFIFSADGYKTSAVLSFYSDSTKIYGANVIGKEGLQFSIVDNDLTHLHNRDAIFLDSEKHELSGNKLGKWRTDLTQCFEGVTELEPIVIRNSSNRILRKFLVYQCSGYKGVNLE